MKRQGKLPDGTPYVRLYIGGKEEPSIPSDVLGSYTGMSEDLSPPVQDADDL